MISVFDSHSRDTSGLSSPDGRTIVTIHPNMRHLVMFIRDLTLPLSLGDSCPLEIVPVSMFQRTDSNYADSDSTATSASFLGFSDSKMYLNTTSIKKDLDTEAADENILFNLKQNVYDDDYVDNVPLAQFAGIAKTNLESGGSEYTLSQS
ncbi:hypothetical protein ACJMK2_003564 [Sinanodonta woodiana]|uniref:Uncharacterized protein n=1 Tax=Sinanodonta woodiana TaxID=1069815 RepID=A0ABD3XYK9_SINWO